MCDDTSETYTYNRAYEYSNQCLVIDLDRAMLYTHELGDKSEFMDAITVTRHGAINQCLMVPDWNRITNFRPHCKEFLDYAEFRFGAKVVWSAGGLENVHMLVNALTDMSCIRFDLVLSMDDTEFTVEQPYGVKDLGKVYSSRADPRIHSLLTTTAPTIRLQRMV